uniref:Ankyrin repeat protein n=1 Tax=Pithovirus LCPAC202 TaxID=2506592 RepID=A0A481Z6E6_9VIRU|nr:MAG: hypothetical protein LCPAC202_01500 [Pithovirus LCPAC202]
MKIGFTSSINMLNNNFLLHSGLRASSPIFVPISNSTEMSSRKFVSLLDRNNKIQRTPLNKLIRSPIIQLCIPGPFDSKELEELEEDDNSVDSYYSLPDFREFRSLTLSVQIPPDFHRMVKEVLFILPIIKIAAKHNGKIFGGLLREMILIAFQPISFNSKATRLVNYLTQNHVNIWIPINSLDPNPLNDTKIETKTVRCTKSNTHYQVITSSHFSHLIDSTINSLVLTLSPSHGYKLGVRGIDNNISIALDDIRKKRLHIITSDIEGNINLLNVMIRASILFDNGWKPLNIEDRELVRNLFQKSSSAIIMKSNRNPLLKVNKTQSPSGHLIYKLLVSYYPDLAGLVNPICHDQIKACYLLAIMHKDKFNLTNLLKISRTPDIKFALYIASEIGSTEIFGLLFQKSSAYRENTMIQKCLVIALLHDNLDIINYIHNMKIRLPINCEIVIPDVSICWHQHRNNSPCNFRKTAQMTKQIRINHLYYRRFVRN